jgi:hypothetical protein
LNRSIVEAARRDGFLVPPPRVVPCPIWDLHVHFGRNDEQAAHDREFVEVARRYGVQRIVNLAWVDRARAVMDEFPEVRVAMLMRLEKFAEPRAFAEENLAILDRGVAMGIRICKFWIAPRMRDRVDGAEPRLDDARCDPIFEAIERHGLLVMVHVADPDRWFATKYADAARYGTKADQYPQLEMRLARHRSIPFQAAHMGGDPENLEHLHGLLERHANLYLDTSATKWIVRELGARRRTAREFLTAWADRIVFGTDQVVIENPEVHRYALRYWMHRMFWETDVVCPSPLADDDADGEPVLRGLALPAPVLEKIYWRTPQRLHGLVGL